MRVLRLVLKMRVLKASFKDEGLKASFKDLSGRGRSEIIWREFQRRGENEQKSQSQWSVGAIVHLKIYTIIS